MTPVTLPPGRLKLATKPNLTGSPRVRDVRLGSKADVSSVRKVGLQDVKTRKSIKKLSSARSATMTKTGLCRRRGASKPGRGSPSCRGTLPPDLRSRCWWMSGGLDHQTHRGGQGMSWQQGPLSTGAIGQFLVREPLPKSPRRLRAA
jgi:hypothetical protein